MLFLSRVFFVGLLFFFFKLRTVFRPVHEKTLLILVSSGKCSIWITKKRDQRIKKYFSRSARKSMTSLERSPLFARASRSSSSSGSSSSKDSFFRDFLGVIFAAKCLRLSFFSRATLQKRKQPHLEKSTEHS